MFFVLFSVVNALAVLKTGGGYEITNDSINASGGLASGAGYSLISAAGQPAGFGDLFQTPGNFTSGYMLEAGFVSGVEAVFDQFNIIGVITAPTAGGYLGTPTDAVPGARITYQLNYSNKGEAAINSVSGATYGFSNIVVQSQLPPEMQYETGTIKLNSVAQTDASDFPGTDSCSYNSGASKVVCIVPMMAGATGTVQFNAIIK
jgi:hypothetical protein